MMEHRWYVIGDQGHHPVADVCSFARSIQALLQAHFPLVEPTLEALSLTKLKRSELLSLYHG